MADDEKRSTPAPKKKPSLADRLREPEEVPVELPLLAARARTRRDFLLFGASGGSSPTTPASST